MQFWWMMAKNQHAVSRLHFLKADLSILLHCHGYLHQLTKWQDKNTEKHYWILFSPLPALQFVFISWFFQYKSLYLIISLKPPETILEAWVNWMLNFDKLLRERFLCKWCKMVVSNILTLKKIGLWKATSVFFKHFSISALPKSQVFPCQQQQKQGDK